MMPPFGEHGEDCAVGEPNFDGFPFLRERHEGPAAIRGNGDMPLER